jgi:transcriptional regulator with GAF, ATPase, and Fis domain
MGNYRDKNQTAAGSELLLQIAERQCPGTAEQPAHRIGEESTMHDLEVHQVVQAGDILQKSHDRLEIMVDERTRELRQPEAAGEEVKGLGELEHEHILRVLLKTSWRIEGTQGAALLLGLNASTLRARMRKYGTVRT